MHDSGVAGGTSIPSRRGLRFTFLDRESPRILLFFFAVVLGLVASAISGIGFVTDSPVLLLTGTAVWLVWFGVMFMVAVPATDRLLRHQVGWLRRGAVAILIALLVAGLAEVVALSLFYSWFDRLDLSGNALGQSLAAMAHGFAYNDATALSHQAAENLRHGENPYEKANIVSAFKAYDLPSDRLTPLRVGRFAHDFPYPEPDKVAQLWQEALSNPAPVPPEIESGLCYPAGDFLLLTPFLLAGINDVRGVYAIFVLVALAVVTWLVPRGRRLVFVSAALISLELWDSVGSGETGSLCFPLLLLGWVLPRRSLWLSALFMGLAVATKQTAWFFLPFYLILVLKPRGLKSLLMVIGIIMGVFMAANAPFLVSDPDLWFKSVMAPVAERMFPLGVGVVTLVTGGVLDIRSPLLFSVLELGVFGLSIVWYFRNYRRYPQTAPILAVLPLFFAWRSLWNYFFYADIIMLAGILIGEYGGEADFTSYSRPAPA
jgi:hypothetical protein